jgi:hypothetical protein
MPLGIEAVLAVSSKRLFDESNHDQRLRLQAHRNARMLAAVPTKFQFSFLIEPLGENDSTPSVVPMIDGRRLTELVAEFEDRCGYEPAGGYAGLVPSRINLEPLFEYFMAESPSESTRKAGYYLLGCTCGEAGCWPLMARIAKEEGHVTWHEFTQPFRPERDYSSFGPFSFDLEEYRHAVAEMVSKLKAQ